VHAPESNEPKRVRTVRIDLSVRSALLVVGTAAVVWLFLQLWQILLVVIVAMMLVGMLNPLVERLHRRHVRRGFAIAIVFAVLFLFLAGLGALFVPRIVSQAIELIDHFPDSQAKLAGQLASSKLTAPLAGSVRAVRLADLSERAQAYGFAYAPAIAEIVAYAVTAFFLALYFIIDRDRMRGALFSLVPRPYHVRLSRVLVNLEVIVGGYMRGQAITSGLMALFTFVVLLIAGVPNALALALFAGVVDILPYVGALLACAPAFFAALGQGTTVAFVVLVVLGTYQEFESRVVVPRVYGRALRLPSAAVMIALLIGGKLLGILGALLALPIAAGIRMALEELRVALPGEGVDDAELRAKDERAEAEFEARAAGVPACEAAMIATEMAEERHAEEEAAESEPGSAALVPVTGGKLDSERD